MTTEGASSPNPTGKSPSLIKFAVPIVVILVAVFVVLAGLRMAGRFGGDPLPGAATDSAVATAPGGGGAAATAPTTDSSGANVGAEAKGGGGGAPLPDLALQEFGGPVRKLSDLKKKVVMINFWATWCEACMVEMPSIVKLRDAYKDKGFEVIGLNLDENPQAAVPGAVKKMGITFPVFTDPAGALPDRFDIHAIPVSIFLDAERRVLLTYNGERDWNNGESRALIDRFLEGPRGGGAAR